MVLIMSGNPFGKVPFFSRNAWQCLAKPLGKIYVIVKQRSYTALFEYNIRFGNILFYSLTGPNF